MLRRCRLLGEKCLLVQTFRASYAIAGLGMAGLVPCQIMLFS